MATKRILLIDDEPDVCEIAKISLSITKQWLVLTESSGLKAVYLAAAEKPDAILLDLSMPDISGLETLKMLRRSEKTASTPVILLTATAKPEVQLDLADLEAQGILVKPFDPGLLGDQIEQLLGWD